jgi:hypothetical protein
VVEVTQDRQGGRAGFQPGLAIQSFAELEQIDRLCLSVLVCKGGKATPPECCSEDCMPGT